MKATVFTIRMSSVLTAELSRQAAQRGVTRTSWVTALIERGMLVDSVERAIERLEHSAVREARPAPGSAPAPTLPPAEIWEKLIFNCCFNAALLKGLNVTLNRSAASEVGRLAAAARDQATAETHAWLAKRPPSSP